ncbi:MAG TPA: hypothetical protein DEF36_21215 [Desulfotomaculum sp.]|nr:hypothetical protein [Desulfotomaculum sp.]
MLRSKAFLILICFIIISVVLPPGNSYAGLTDFKDLTMTSPEYPYIKFLIEKDLIKGYPDGNFLPEGQITRAEAAALLVKAAGLSPERTPGAAFIDVRPEHWACGIIESAAAAGIIRGDPDGLFRPEDPVSRAEVAVLLLKLTQEPLPSVELPQYVADVGPAHWAGQSIAASLRAGLLTGADGYSFLPDRPATRAEVARGLAMMINLAPEHRAVPLTGVLSPIEGEVFVKYSMDYTRVKDKAQCTAGVTVKTGPGGRAEIRFPDGSGLLLEENTLLTIKEARGQSTILRDGSPGAVIDYLELELPQGRIFGGLAAGYIYGQEQSGLKDSGLPAARAAEPGGKLLASTSLLPPGVWPSLAVEDNVELPWWEEGYDKHVRVQVDMPWGVAGIRGTFWMNTVSSQQQSTSVIDGAASLTSNGVTVGVSSGQESIINSPSSAPSQPAGMTAGQQRAWAEVSAWVQERASAIQNAAPVVSPAAPVFNTLQPLQPQQSILPPLPPLPDLSGLLESMDQTTDQTTTEVTNTNQSGSQDSGSQDNDTVLLGSMGSLTVTVGQQMSVTAAVSPADAVLTAISSDTGIAVVSVTDKTIYVDGVANGTANITVTASKSGYDTAEITFPVTVNNAGQVSSPTAIPPAGTYSGVQSVSLSTLTDGADIWYTTDGSDPTTSGARQHYSTAFTVGDTKTVKAYAVKAGLSDSDVVSFNYVININNTISLNPIGSLIVEMGKQEWVVAAVDPTEAVITAFSSDTGIAEVSVTGKTIYVDGVSSGTANITVTASMAGYDSAQVSFAVTVSLPAVPVAGWYTHSLMSKDDGTVWAWGDNGYGQIGDGTASDRYSPMQVLGAGGAGYLDNVTALDAGRYHSVALKTDGTVWAWGRNNIGQLGNGTTINSYTPVQVKGPSGTGFLTGIVAIASGYQHVAALRSDGAVFAWGSNNSGELGNGTENESSLPVQVLSPDGAGYLTDIIAIAAGNQHTLALQRSGKVWVWGSNGLGELGIGAVDFASHPYPVQVTGLDSYNISAISAGEFLSMALSSDEGGKIWTWGDNGVGPSGGLGGLGDGTLAYYRSSPVQVVDVGGVGPLTGVSAIAAGNYFTVALKGDGTVLTWGENEYGELGIGSYDYDAHPIPVQVPTLSGITGIYAGYQHVFASNDAGDVWGWGTNSSGQLGNGTTSTRVVSPILLHSLDGAVAASPLTIVMASVAADGFGGDGYSEYPSISSDGRYVAFYSDASDLVAGDGNSTDDIFVRDLQNNSTERISVSAGGTDSNSNSYLPSLSADGRYVSFISAASNLVAGDSNNKWDVFVRDRQLGSTYRVSVPDLSSQGTLGSEANNDSYASYFTMFCPSVSSDGRYIAFASQASNLVLGDTNATTDVFVHDRQTGETVSASVYGSGTGGNDWSMKPSISADGRYVAFISNASNLVAGDTNNNPDVFVRDLFSGETVRVSVAGDGTQGNYFSGAIFYPSDHEGNVSISADGRYVVFDSLANNLAPGDTNGATDIFVHDRDTDEDGIYDEPGAVSTAMVSVSSAGDQANSYSEKPSISPSGRYVAFVSQATNLAAGATTSIDRIYIRDLQLNTTERASAYTGRWPCVSNDGRVAFYSASTNLLPEDTNVYNDVFVRLP